MDFDKLCNDIMESDHRIRFVAVYDNNIEKLGGGMRNGQETYLPEDIIKVSIDGSFMRWRSRKEMSHWIGEPMYAMTEYGKIKRFTFQMSPKKIMLVSTEKDINNNALVKTVFDKSRNMGLNLLSSAFLATQCF